MTLTARARARYARQLVLPELGADGQAKLAAGRVLIAGLGGLGTPAARYLAGAGVGMLRLVDPDEVALDNLHRQILYTEDDVGKSKSQAAAAHLARVNSAIEVEALPVFFAPENAAEMLAGCHLAIDATDTFAARIALNRAAVAAGVPLIHGAAEGFEGQVTVFWPAGGAPCYECLYPPTGTGGGGCAERGVLGPVPGLIGTLQALEAIKLIAGIGDVLCGRLLRFEARGAAFRISRIVPDPACRVCGGS